MKKLFFMTLCLLVAGMSVQAGDKKVYSKVIDDGKTLLFLYDDQMESVDASQHPTEYKSGDKPGERFAGYNTGITAIELDESMKDAKLTSLIYFFGGNSTANSLKYVTEIRHLDYLNTSDCLSMNYMFYDMESLESVDLSKFDTQKVQLMTRMFMYCKKLKSIDVSKFNTSKVVYMDWMFFDCRELETLDVTNFNTSNVTNMSSMFQNCSKIRVLDISNFDMSKVTNFSYMFTGCTRLVTLICDQKWSLLSVTEDGNMFQACNKLIGEKGTACDGTNTVDKTYARPDNGVGNEGYFTTTSSYELAKKNLDDIISEMEKMDDYADSYLDSADNRSAVLAPLAIAINNAKAAFTYPELQAAVSPAEAALKDAIEAFVEGANEEICLVIDEMAEGKSAACKAIANMAKWNVNVMLVWDFDKSVDENFLDLYENVNTSKGYQIVSQADKQINEQHDRDVATEKLRKVISELQDLYNFADDYADAATLKPIQDQITAAQDVLDNPASTVGQLVSARTAASNALKTDVAALLLVVKQEACDDLDGLSEKDDSEACKQIIADAKLVVNAISYDDTKSVKENIDIIKKSIYDNYMQTQANLEAQREKDHATAIETTDVQSNDVQCIKAIRNGQLLIQNNGTKYNAQGQEVK